MLASDGLFDLFKANDLKEFYKSYSNNLFLENLVNICIDKISVNNNITIDELKNLGKNKKRREIHDDISIAYINFQ